MERESGKYKVKIDNQCTIAVWHNDDEYWILNNIEDDTLTDHYFDEIGDKVE